MRTLYKAFLFVFISGLFASCEVEFSPNDTWREIPVVYCLLDQDDDTSYVRVQRCFLGEGNQYQFASVGDSINYPQGALTVFIEEWNAQMDANGNVVRSGASPRRVLPFDYTEVINKEEGLFYNTVQPLYVCATAGTLDSSYIYVLKVIKNSTGDTIAKSETRLVYGDMQLIKPNNVNIFRFSGVAGSKVCEISWTALEEARQYQPVVRFFYRQFMVNYNVVPADTTIVRHYIDIPCNAVKSNMRDRSFSTKLEQNFFLSEIKRNIVDSTSNKNIIDTVQIFVNCCGEPLAAYIYAGSPAGSLTQDPFVYTNIEGGLGVFAARRCHISFLAMTPASGADNYVRAIKELNIGF